MKPNVRLPRGWGVCSLAAASAIICAGIVAPVAAETSHSGAGEAGAAEAPARRSGSGDTEKAKRGAAGKAGRGTDSERARQREPQFRVPGCRYRKRELDLIV